MDHSQDLSHLLVELLDSSEEEDYHHEDWLISSSSEDDDLELLLEERIIPKNEGFFVVIEKFDEHTFIEHFRISRKVAERISVGFQRSEHFHAETGGNGKLNAWQQTIVFLWYVGHQTASFRDVADRFHITKSSLHRVSRRLIFFLSSLSARVIRWPSEAEKHRISQSFRDLGFLDNVIGAVDGSHIRIDRPTEDAESYCNRKKYFSLQVQVSCDDQLKITSLFVGFPGSVHDARVFRRSPLGRNLPGLCGDFVILGDTAYPCSRNLLTPFKDTGTLNSRKKKFNKKLSRCRVKVEHCYGLLKQNFRQLFHCKLRSISDIAHLIRACCVLHNLAINDDFEPAAEDTPTEDEIIEMEEEEDELQHDGGPDAEGGIAYRNYVLTNPIFN